MTTGPAFTSRKPRFNHVAMSLPSDLLDEANRADLCRFYGEVFGFEELPTMSAAMPSCRSPCRSARVCAGTSSIP